MMPSLLFWAVANIFLSSTAWGQANEGNSRAANFLVSSSLPNVTFPLPQMWAGPLGIPGSGAKELFFWLFATENQAYDDYFIIWLNGGPGCTSMEGLFKENGPLSFTGNRTTPVANPNSWTKLGHVLYIDQPVGTGYSDGSKPAASNDEVTADFVAWLGAFYQAFPQYKTKKLFITGESYAGTYAILDAGKRLPLRLQSITIGDGTFGNMAAATDVVATTYMKQQNGLLHVPSNILSVFQAADKQCGFDKVISQLQYPPKGKIEVPGNPEGSNYRLHQRIRNRFRRVKRQEGEQNDSCHTNTSSAEAIKNSIDQCYGGCATNTVGAAYLQSRMPCFDVYNINNNCQTVPSNDGYVAYLNSQAVRNAIHAPGKKFELCNEAVNDILSTEPVEPPAYRILPSLLDQGLKVHFYSGDYDFLLNHLGTELVIQNMTWGGLQGFQAPPRQPFVVNGQMMGIWGRERNVSYHHIIRAGHMVPADQPAAAFAFIKNFVLKDLRT